MNFVPFILLISFLLFGTNTKTVISLSTETVEQKEQLGVPSANQLKNDENIVTELDQQKNEMPVKRSNIKGRKGVSSDTQPLSTEETSGSKISTTLEKSNISSTSETQHEIDKTSDSNKLPLQSDASNDRASSTIIQSNSEIHNESSKETESNKTTKESTSSSKSQSNKSSKSSDTSSSVHSSSQTNTSHSTNTSKSSSTSSSVSTESTSHSKSSSDYKKPLITYSVEDEPDLLNVQRVRQYIPPLTPTDEKLEAENPAYLPPSIDFVIDRNQNKREMYIFPIVVLIFIVPMILGIGIVILRHVRDYWSTRHYRRMDFLVDGMYNA